MTITCTIYRACATIPPATAPPPTPPPPPNIPQPSYNVLLQLHTLTTYSHLERGSKEVVGVGLQLLLLLEKCRNLPLLLVNYHVGRV